MLNLPEDLPLSLRQKLSRRIAAKPELEGLVKRLIEKRAATDSERERAAVESLLRSISEPNRKGWFIAGGIIIVLLGVVLLDQTLEAREKRAVEAGAPAVAEVKRIEPGNCLVGTKKSSCVRLTLDVHPEGQASYSAELTHLVPNIYLPRVQSGAWIFVSIDRTDRREVLLDERKLAEPPPEPAKRL